MSTDNQTSPSPAERFNRLHEQVRELSFLWQTQRELFTPKNIELIKRSCGNFFSLVQIVMERDYLRYLSAAWDPPGGGDIATLSIRRLPEILKESGQNEAASEAAQKIDSVKEPHKILKAYRHKVLIHWDLKVADGKSGPRRPSIDETDELVTALWSVMNIGHRVLEGLEHRYDDPIHHCPGDIMAMLRYGEWAADLKRRTLRQELTAQSLFDEVYQGPVLSS